MSYKRSLTNLPDYYHRLSTKQQAAWRKTTRKMERNEQLRTLYPPYQSLSNINIIHIHRLSTIPQIDELISKAKCTKRFVMDTESQRGERINKGALIQLQMIHSINDSTVILIEAHHLPNPTSTLFKKIKDLCGIIFNKNNEIISWGKFNDEVKDFHYLDLIHPGNISPINLQFLFSNPSDYNNTHPAGDSCANLYYDILENDNDDYNNDNIFNDVNQVQVNEDESVSLQHAVETTFKKFLDKSLTYNYWKCGLDARLDTWKTKLFSGEYYDERLEKHQRQLMIQYAVHDCTSVAEIFFQMYPEKMNNHQTPPETPPLSTTKQNAITTNSMTIQFENNFYEDLMDVSEDDERGEILSRKYPQEQPPISQQTPEPLTTSTRIVYINNNDELSEISEDELIELLKPKFNKQKVTAQLTTQDDLTETDEDELHKIKFPYFNKPEKPLQTTIEEINEFNAPEDHPMEQLLDATLVKKNKQKRKNEKLKGKRRTREEFQNFIRRPIYHQYDYLKIKAQLREDDLHTTHQITIDRRRLEVKIGFKSRTELQQATTIIRTDYFSKTQYNNRWGK